MRKLLILIFVIGSLALPANATELAPPTTPAAVEKYMPKESTTFGKDLWYIVKSAISYATPGIWEAMSVCASVISCQLLISVLHCFTGIGRKTVALVGVLAMGALLLAPSKALIGLGMETIQSISEYNKLLLPVMTAALAAQGGTATSAALYAGTVVLDTILTVSITKVILPILYAYIAVGIASSAIEEPILQNILIFLKWLATWLLKITIYVFTGYIGITGVISGSVDTSALKATKLAISGTVPVIGNIISDASETILVSAGVVKNSVGAYGALVILSIWIMPFLRIGIQYLMLKITAGISSLFADKQTVSVVEHTSTVMGFLLAMTSTVCLLLLISVVCFMKGMNG